MNNEKLLEPFKPELPLQVKDDAELLELMLQDSRSAPEIYRPTNYWAYHERISVPEFFKLGLKDFRRRTTETIVSMGATDPSPAYESRLLKNPLLNHAFLNRLPLWRKAAAFLGSLPFRLGKSLIPYDVTPEDVRFLCYHLLELEARLAGAKPPAEFEASLFGNPEDVFEIKGRIYTMSLLRYYYHYVYCSRFVPFDNIRLVVEVGTGSGKQIEVLRKLYPHLCFYLFDLPPQSYVCEQYLKSIFAGDVISYRETRKMNSAPGIQPGKIFVFPNWKFPLVEQASIDLFWNSASFQEMEPEVTAHYLSPVNRRAQSVFLLECMKGTADVAKRPGGRGVLKQTKLEDYKAGLGNFDLVDLRPYLFLPRSAGKRFYSFSFWKRKA